MCVYVYASMCEYVCTCVFSVVSVHMQACVASLCIDSWSCLPRCTNARMHKHMNQTIVTNHSFLLVGRGRIFMRCIRVLGVYLPENFSYVILGSSNYATLPLWEATNMVVY